MRQDPSTDAASIREEPEEAVLHGPYIRQLVGETSAFSRLALVEPFIERAGPVSPQHAGHAKRVQLPPEASSARSSRLRGAPWKEKVLRALKYRVRLLPHAFVRVLILANAARAQMCCGRQRRQCSSSKDMPASQHGGTLYLKLASTALSAVMLCMPCLGLSLGFSSPLPGQLAQLSGVPLQLDECLRHVCLKSDGSARPTNTPSSDG